MAENVALLTGYPRRSGLIDWRAAAEAARAALGRMGSSVDPETRVGTLSAADKSIVAIARALACRSDLLVLDEPTAALPAADVERLLDTLVRLKAGGIGLIYVTHRLDEVFRIADRLTVLRDGRRIATRAIAETSSPGARRLDRRRRLGANDVRGDEILRHRSSRDRRSRRVAG